MESTEVESRESLLHYRTLTSSKLKPKASPPEAAFLTASERPYRDSFFTFLFLATIVTIFLFGIIASTHRDPINLDIKLRLSNFNPTTNKCEITRQTVPEEDPASASASAFVSLTSIAFVTSLALTFPLTLLLTFLLYRYTRPVMLLSTAIASLFPLGICIFLFSWCLSDPDVTCAVLGSWSKRIVFLVAAPASTALLEYDLWKSWKGGAFEKGAQALSMATKFLEKHSMVLIVNPVSLLGWMVFVNGPILTYMWHALNVGEIVPDFGVVRDPTKGCELATGSPCCRTERPGWVYAYITFASLTAFWVLWVSLALPRFVEGGAVSQWYFAPTGSATTGNIKRSLRNAYGPLFGTVCCGATIVSILFVAWVGHFKKVSDRVMNSNRQSRLFRGCFSWMSQFPGCQPMFVSTIASISGDSFWESSKKSYNLFLRTSLPFTVTTDGPYHYSAVNSVMSLNAICTLLQALVVYAVLGCFSNAESEAKFLIAMLCSLLIFFWLISLMGTLSCVSSTVYICYAMEKDVGEISKPEVCHALLVIPPSSPENGA